MKEMQRIPCKHVFNANRRFGISGGFDASSEFNASGEFNVSGKFQSFGKKIRCEKAKIDIIMSENQGGCKYGKLYDLF